MKRNSETVSVLRHDQMILKLEMKGTAQAQYRGGLPEMVGNCAGRNEADAGCTCSHYFGCRRRCNSHSSCFTAARKGRIHQYSPTVARELQPPDMQRRVVRCQSFQIFAAQNRDILEMTWFSDGAWFHLSGYAGVSSCKSSCNSRSLSPST